MQFEETDLSGAYIITLEPHADERGSFTRHFCQHEMTKRGLPTTFVQCNLSHNIKSGTLRGLHYQIAPHGENKMVLCQRGEIYDVIVDLRPSSPTYTKWLGITLHPYQAIYIPAGFAHGFQTLCDDTDVLYMMGHFYHAASARGIRWNDTYFNITWPLTEKIVSERDQRFPEFIP